MKITEDHMNPFVPNTLLGIAGGLLYRKLKRVSKDPRKASEKTLRQILTYAKDSVYGKEHHFEDILKAKTDEELYRLYRENVKPNEYEDLRPYVDRHKNGEANVLFPGKPVLYATTSGSTNQPKWIPITQQYIDNIYSKMNKVWLYNFQMNRPHVWEGSIVSIVGKYLEGYAPDGTMYGSVSGYTQAKCPGFVKRLYASPSEVFYIEDYTARNYAIMRMGIERNVHLCVTANPSTMVEMQNNVNRYLDDYIDDIEHGTMSKKVDIPDNIRAAIQPYLKPNPDRANELRELRAKYGTILPKHFWPELQVLTTWKCGNTKVYLEKLEGCFPEGMLYQEFAYFSSECRFGLVLDDSINTTLFPHYHYYEFVPEEDFGSENPRFLQLHELEVGKRYCPYCTTFAGLYRYNMNDIIEVSDYFVNTPRIHMVQKVNGIVTLTGEKLYEQQFIDAVREAEKSTGMKTKFFIGFADISISGYHFYYEFENQDTTIEQANEFTKVVDDNLKKANIEYQAKRDSFRLKDPISHLLEDNSFEKFKEATLKITGADASRFKPNVLMQNDEKHELMKRFEKK